MRTHIGMLTQRHDEARMELHALTRRVRADARLGPEAVQRSLAEIGQLMRCVSAQLRRLEAQKQSA